MPSDESIMSMMGADPGQNPAPVTLHPEPAPTREETVPTPARSSAPEGDVENRTPGWLVEEVRGQLRKLDAEFKDQTGIESVLAKHERAISLLVWAVGRLARMTPTDGKAQNARISDGEGPAK